MDYITVETLDGRHVLVNPRAIVTIGGPRKDDRLLNPKAACQITLVDGKFIVTAEICDAIRQRLPK